MAIGKLAAEFSAGDKGLQDELAGIESALKSSGLSASAFAKRFNESLDSAEKSAGTLMPVIEKLQTKIAILKRAMQFETDPKAVQAMGRELKALDIQMLETTGKTYEANRKGTRLLTYEYHHAASAMFALSMVMGIFNTSADSSTGKTKVLKEAMDKGVQAALGMSFGLMMLGPRFAALVGPVGIGIGVIMALVAAFHAANEEAQKATEEGVKRFSESFDKLPRESQRKVLAGFAERRKAIEAELASITHAYGPAAQFRPLLEMLDTKNAARISKLKEQDDLYGEIIKKYKKELEYAEMIDRAEDMGTKILADQGSEVARINQEMKQLKEEIQTGAKYHSQMALSAEEMQQDVDRLAKLEYERSRLLMTSRDRAMEGFVVEKARYELGLSSAPVLLKQLEIVKGLARGTKEVLAAETERQSILDHEANLEVQRTQIRLAAGKKIVDAEIRQEDSLRDLQIGNIVNKWDRDREKADEQHRLNIVAIQTEADESRNHDLEALKVIEENRRYKLETVAIERDRQQAMFDDILQGASSVASAMQSAFGGAGDSLIGKLGQALQVAFQIARAIQAANAPNAGPGAGLGVFGSILGIFGLFKTPGFARGGYTGSGPRNEISGPAHKGEIYFEKPLVDVYGGMLMALRSSLQKGYASGGFTGSGGVPGMGRGEFMMNGTLDMINGETKLRVWMPGYERWNSKKTP